MEFYITKHYLFRFSLALSLGALLLFQSASAGSLKAQKAPRTTKKSSKCSFIIKEAKEKPSDLNPLLLADIESTNFTLVNPDSEWHIVRRGFSIPDYTGPKWVRYLFGDWHHVVASWSFSKILEEKLSKGDKYNDAILETANEISTAMKNNISRTGLKENFSTQSRNTWLAIKNEDKDATGMASYPVHNRLEEEGMTPDPFSYSSTAYRAGHSKRDFDPADVLIVADIEQKKLPYENPGEYQILSHIPPTKVSRFFLGYPGAPGNKKTNNYGEEMYNWYVLDIHGRDTSGKPFRITIQSMKENLRGFMRSWSLGGKLWDSAQADSLESAEFREAHPTLRETMDEILELSTLH